MFMIGFVGLFCVLIWDYDIVFNFRLFPTELFEMFIDVGHYITDIDAYKHMTHYINNSEVSNNNNNLQNTLSLQLQNKQIMNITIRLFVANRLHETYRKLSYFNLEAIKLSK